MHTDISEFGKLYPTRSAIVPAGAPGFPVGGILWYTSFDGQEHGWTELIGQTQAKASDMNGDDRA